MDPKKYREEILGEFVRRFEEKHNSLPDAYALIWSIDVYASLVWKQMRSMETETDFKNDIERNSEAFRIIRSASNAIKHIERHKDEFVVKSMNDISAGEGSSFHAWFAKGNSEPSIAITMNWLYDREMDEYSYSKGTKLAPAPQNPWKTQYLIKLYGPAIAAIDWQLKVKPV